VEVLEEVGVTIADESLVDSIAEANGRAGAPEEADWSAAREQPLPAFASSAEQMTHIRHT
jgi:hypothetical protein